MPSTAPAHTRTRPLAAGLALCLVAALLATPTQARATTTGDLTGTVTALDTGQPLQDVCIKAFPAPSGSFAGQATTGVDGTWTLSLDPGDYYLWAWDCGGAYMYVRTYLGGEYERGDSTTATATSGGTTSGLDIAMPLGGVISGTITGSDATMPPTCLLAYADRTGTDVSTVVDPDGTYELAGVPADSYPVRAIDCGADTNYAQTYYGLTPGNQVDVGVGEVVAGVDITVRPEGEVSGTVTEDATGDPLAGICVGATSQDRSGTWVETTTASDGTYELTELPQADDWRVQFACPPSDETWSPGWWSEEGLVVAAAADEFEVASTPVTALDAALEPPAAATRLGALEFVPLTPCALFDTRAATGGLAGPHSTGDVLTFRAAGTMPPAQGPADCTAPPEDAVAVELNLVAVSPTASGNLKVAPSGRAPEGGIVNYAPGITNSNALPVRVDDRGAIDVHVNSGTTDVRGVALGYWVAEDSVEGLEFVPTTPCAVFDSRTATGDLAGPVDGTIVVGVGEDVPVGQGGAGCPGIDDTAAVMVANVVAIDATGTGNLRAAAPGVEASGGIVNYTAGLTNSSAVALGVDGAEVAITVNGAATHVRVVVLGWFTAQEGSGLELVPATACAVADTRTADVPGPTTASQTWVTTAVPPASQGGAGCAGLDEAATAVHLNLVAVGPASGGNLRLAAADATPEGGVVNYATGLTNANAVPVALDEDGAVLVEVNGGATDLRGVVVGGYVPGDGFGGGPSA